MSQALFPASTTNGGRHVWTRYHCYLTEASIRAAQAVQVAPYIFKTYQELHAAYGTGPVDLEETWVRSIAPRSLLQGSQQSIHEEMERRWAETSREWDLPGGIRDALEASEDEYIEAMDPHTVCFPFITIFFGLGSLQDIAGYPASYYRHLTAEKLAAPIRARILAKAKFELMFDDTRYTEADKAFLKAHFARDVDETDFCTRSTPWNYFPRLAVFPEASPKTDTWPFWEQTMYVIFRGDNPWRQMLADKMLERIEAGKPYPRKVICAAPEDNDDEYGSRNLSSDKVARFLSYFPCRLPLLPYKDRHVGQLYLFTRPKDTAGSA